MVLDDVTLIHKKGPEDILKICRTIRLTSVVCEMREFIIADRIVDDMDTNDFMGNSQHGFCCTRSCPTSLLEIFYCSICMYDYSKAIDILYYAFKNAYEKIPHKGLLTRVSALGVLGRVAERIEHWLSGGR